MNMLDVMVYAVNKSGVILSAVGSMKSGLSLSSQSIPDVPQQKQGAAAHVSGILFVCLICLLAPFVRRRAALSSETTFGRWF